MTSMEYINKTAKFSKNKVSATTIILLLLISMAGSLVFAPTVSAEQAFLSNNHFSYVYCSVARNVYGIGQDQIFAYWTADIPPDTGETEGIIPGSFNRATWTGASFNITTPSGVTTNISSNWTTRLDWWWIPNIYTYRSWHIYC